MIYDVAFETDYRGSDAPIVDDSIAGTIRDLGASIRGAAEGVRRSVAYGEQQIIRGAREGQRVPLDQELNFVQRAWLYSTDMEKVMLILAAAGLAFVVYQQVAR